MADHSRTATVARWRRAVDGRSRGHGSRADGGDDGHGWRTTLKSRERKEGEGGEKEDEHNKERKENKENKSEFFLKN